MAVEEVLSTSIKNIDNDMDADPEGDQITLTLDSDEALVMLEWLGRLEDPEDVDNLPRFDSAVVQLRWDLECLLESSHPDVLAPDYESRLETAIDEVCKDL